MENWYRRISNVLLVAAAVAGLLGIIAATGWFDRPALTADPLVLDLGQVAAGDSVPVTFTLRNHTRKPIRLVGAAAT